ncbi:MAG: BON domain-containing protein [Myxococcota bacterium]|nr:BON domain-containing protein [Myxococcota bacterium]
MTRLIIAFGVSGWVAQADAFTPYRLLFSAVKSPESASVFIQDKRLKSQLKRALVLAVPESTLSVSSYVFGGHAYLVGWVDDVNERGEIEEAAKSIGGIQSVDVYLPIKPKGDAAPSSVDELKLKTSVVASLVEAMGTDQTNVSVDVLGTHVVLVGVVGSASQVHSAREAAEGTKGVSSVTSYLSVPPPADRKLLGRRLP